MLSKHLPVVRFNTQSEVRIYSTGTDMIIVWYDFVLSSINCWGLVCHTEAVVIWKSWKKRKYPGSKRIVL